MHKVIKSPFPFNPIGLADNFGYTVETPEGKRFDLFVSGDRYILGMPTLSDPITGEVKPTQVSISQDGMVGLLYIALLMVVQCELLGPNGEQLVYRADDPDYPKYGDQAKDSPSTEAGDSSA